MSYSAFINSHVPMRMLYGPAAYCSRGIENLLIRTKQIEGLEHTITCLAAKAIGLTVFPACLMFGLIFEPLFLGLAIAKYYAGYEEAAYEWAYSAERIEKLALGIIFSPAAILAADGVSYLFLEKVPSDQKILPFGVEEIYGTSLENPILYPSSIPEVQEIVRNAKKLGKTVSIIGTNMSQGMQTIPVEKHGVVINLKKLNKVSFSDQGDHLIKADAGALWEEVQLEANKRGKSVIVKQASDLFSVGGSIGINCHGWQHASGAIASTVESLEVVDANGDLRILSREKDPEFFRCMFGTLGYFGVVVNATLRLENNTYLQEHVHETSIEDFISYYKENIRHNEAKPLLMGRLNISKNPLKHIFFNTFEKTLPEPTSSNLPTVTENFKLEPHRGARIERIFLNAVGHLPQFIYDKLIDFYWKRELEIMKKGRVATRNEIMHFGAKSFFQLHQSDLYTQFLQEYFVSEDNFSEFISFLGDILEKNNVRLLNATVRPTPKDTDSILPYAEKDRYAIVISFSQLKTKKELIKTEAWIKKVHEKLLSNGDKWYQAYMPYYTQEEFEKCYGIDTVNKMRELKAKYDPTNLFSNKHTQKYYDKHEGN